MEALVIASRLFHTKRQDPYDPQPSGLRRLLAAIGIVGMMFIGLQSVAAPAPTGYGLAETALAAPEPLR
jgi:hypothetical protein